MLLLQAMARLGCSNTGSGPIVDRGETRADFSDA
jgi:hypothetical protein